MLAILRPRPRSWWYICAVGSDDGPHHSRQPGRGRLAAVTLRGKQTFQTTILQVYVPLSIIKMASEAVLLSASPLRPLGDSRSFLLQYVELYY